MCVGRYAAKVMAQWKITGAMIKLLPNCEWNQKQKHKKQPWGNVECFAFGVGIVWVCVIGNEFPCRQPAQSLRHPLTRNHHIAPRIKTARRFTAKNT